MSNESNREERSISPSDLQASDFFPPGTGWNVRELTPEEIKQKAAEYERDCAADAGRSH
jgi:hypothetical protein